MPSENRPAPAVGQVWRTRTGLQFLVFYDPFRDQYNRLADDGLSVDVDELEQVVNETDTYVGQFRGFKVEGME